jgi:Heterokaryon incompatibility protein (HET)
VIKIRLQEYDLNNSPSYKALSYTWGIDRSYRERMIRAVIIDPPQEFFQGVFNTVSRVVTCGRTSKPDVTDLEPKRSGSIDQAETMSNGESRPEGGRPGSASREERLRRIKADLQQSRQDAKRKNSDNSTRVVVCNGKPLRCGLNLYNALREISSGEGQLWWIDAICIDQSNITERGAQVDLMANIYGLAEEVFVWLGKTSPFTEKIPSFLASLPSYVDQDQQEISTRAKQPMNREALLSNPIPILENSVSKWLGIILLFRRHWFRRTWVLQEVMLAKEITFCLGNHVISENALINAAEWVGFLLPQTSAIPIADSLVNQYIAETPTMIKTLKRRNQFRNGVRWQLEDYLMAARGREVTDEKDIAFAGYSLVNRTDLGEGKIMAQSSLLKADYTKTVTQVFQECTEYLLVERLGLRTLSLVGDHSEQRFRPYPSWVPDFTEVLMPTPFWAISGDAFQAFSSANTVRCFEVDNLVLNLRGFQWDEVSTVGRNYDDLNWENFRSRIIGRIWDIIDVLVEIDANYLPTGEATLTALWRTLIADPHRGPHPASLRLSSSFFRWLTRLLAMDMSIHAKPRSASDKLYSYMYNDTTPEKRALMEAKLEKIFATHGSMEFPIRRAYEYYMDAFNSSNDAADRPSSFENPTISFGERETNSTVDWLGPDSSLIEGGDRKHHQGNSRKIEDNAGRSRKAPDLRPELDEDFGTIMKDRNEERRIYLTKKGYLGLGPMSVRAGDAIMLIQGSDVPFIFRKAVRTSIDSLESVESRQRKHVESNPQARKSSTSPEPWSRRKRPQAGTVSWRLVGETYVYGIMHGEAVDDKTEPLETICVI